MAALPLLLSEVLANEPGSVTSLEFIELVSWHPVQEGSGFLVANDDTTLLPEGPLDSGSFLVVCRDRQRFEAHFGDSSGVWGDSDREDYPLQEVSMSLPNGAGYVAWVQGGAEDRFEWTGDAPDGSSYERVSDSLWRITDASVKCTPGRRNSGLPADFDWSLERMQMQPGPIRSGEPIRLTVLVRNMGLQSSEGTLSLVFLPYDTLTPLPYSGGPGTLVNLYADLNPRPGLNIVQATLGRDDRLFNNTGQLAFYAGAVPILFSEIYPAPLPGQPEWVELFVATVTGTDSIAVSFTDGSDTAQVPSNRWPAGSFRFVMLTADTLLFRLAYPEVSAPLVQPPVWPSLNNDGDSLQLVVFGTAVDHAAFPSPGSRRGVAYERMGTSSLWGWSVHPSGSSPGAVNSIDVPYTDGIRVDVQPNPFAARQGEQANVKYTVPFGAQADLRLFSGDGRLVRTLFERRSVVSGSADWDGHADNGAPVPVGIYILQLRLFEPREQVYLGTVVVAR